MNRGLIKITFRSSISLIIFGALFPPTWLQADDPSLVTSLQKRIDQFHQGAENNQEKLKVVYFYAADNEPQKGYQQRLDRIVKDIQDFYYQEMQRLGFTTGKLPLELEDNQLKLHVVQGKDIAENYQYRDSRKIHQELFAALQGKVDFQHDYVLVMAGLCQKRGENHYFFHAPYYGSGNHQRGLCWAADSEILDITNLSKDKTARMRYDEHSGTFYRSIASFNTLYIGGTAHELGHGLSLPHNNQTPLQKKELGTALMGSGNYTYRNDLWSDDKGSFLTLASAIRLAVHPLFTQSDRQRERNAYSKLKELSFEADGPKLKIKGQVESNLKTLAIIAYTDPDGRSNYDAVPWVAEVKDGKFEVQTNHFRPGLYNLNLTTVHFNGATTQKTMQYEVTKDLQVDSSKLTLQDTQK